MSPSAATAGAPGGGSSIPAWVAYDAQQLAYAAYFVEPSVDGRERVRSCAIRFYLEDGTVDVCEPRVDNSGLDQGKLLKRHRAVASDGRDLTFHHLRVGEPVVIYGREYNVTACDDFTREFLAREGVEERALRPLRLVLEPPAAAQRAPPVCRHRLAALSGRAAQFKIIFW